MTVFNAGNSYSFNPKREHATVRGPAWIFNRVEILDHFPYRTEGMSFSSWQHWLMLYSSHAVKWRWRISLPAPFNVQTIGEAPVSGRNAHNIRSFTGAAL
jgi:hypothetical protein